MLPEIKKAVDAELYLEFGTTIQKEYYLRVSKYTYNKRTSKFIIFTNWNTVEQLLVRFMEELQSTD